MNHSNEWRSVSSFWWKQEDEIRDILNSLYIPYQIKTHSGIKDEGFNLWVKNEDHRRVTIICLMMEGWSEKAAEDFVNKN